MDPRPEYSALDNPELLQYIFYPRRCESRPPAGGEDFGIQVGNDASVTWRFHAHSQDSPSILLFHGYGQVASDYDSTAVWYRESGINLCVADYRGYGSSTGRPTFSGTISDARQILDSFQTVLASRGYTGKLFVMGQSLGSVCAIDVALGGAGRLSGLIVEGGFATWEALVHLMGFDRRSLGIGDLGFPNLTNIRAVKVPTLILHAEMDRLIPVEEAYSLYESAGAADKRLVVIPGVDHHDSGTTGNELYLASLREFVFSR